MGKSEVKTESIWVRLDREPLDVAAADAFLRAPEAGGVCLFAGTTRRQGAGASPTTRLEFDAYEAMALQEMQRLAETARQRWPALQRAVLLHRLGDVPLEEASVVTGASAPHREEAFAVCRFLIDRLKEQVPLWKREHYADGRARWLEGTVPASGQTS